MSKALSLFLGGTPLRDIVLDALIRVPKEAEDAIVRWVMEELKESSLKMDMLTRYSAEETFEVGDFDVSVELRVSSANAGKESGSYDFASRSLRLSFARTTLVSRVRKIVAHELTHVIQREKSLSKSSGFSPRGFYGFPKRKVRDPRMIQGVGVMDLDPGGTHGRKVDTDRWPSKYRKLIQSNVLGGKYSPSGPLHSLDDVEFYPMLRFALLAIRQLSRGLGLKEARQVFNWMVGAGEFSDEKLAKRISQASSESETRDFFRDLKEFNPEKWKNAVKILSKEFFRGKREIKSGA